MEAAADGRRVRLEREWKKKTCKLADDGPSSSDGAIASVSANLPKEEGTTKPAEEEGVMCLRQGGSNDVHREFSSSSSRSDHSCVQSFNWLHNNSLLVNDDNRFDDNNGLPSGAGAKAGQFAPMPQTWINDSILKSNFAHRAADQDWDFELEKY